MELIFLDRRTLLYKDHAFVSNEFELIVDMVISQKSNFIVNKIDIKASLGDIVVLKSNAYSYIGVIETIELVDGIKTKVQANDFKEIFNSKVPIQSFSGDVCAFLKEQIEKYFINNIDTNQNMSYLKVTCNYSTSGTLNFSDDNMMSISSLIELINKTYAVNIKYQVHFLRGRFESIELIIDTVKSGITIKSDLSCISDVVISDSEEQMVNKVVFYPKKDNKTYKDIVTYYLLKDGNITFEKDNPDRYESVCFTSEYYSDKDKDNLGTKARSIMSSKGLDHSVSFKLNMDNNFIKPLNNIFLGDFVEFISKNKRYSTVITQFRFKSGFEECYVTLGEFRPKLTDKIKLLTKSTSSSISNISVSGGNGSGNIDGGTY